MLNTHGTYYFKDRTIKGDRIIYTYILVHHGSRVGTVNTKKEAEAWFRATAHITPNNTHS